MDPVERIWNGWRSQYVSGERPTDGRSVFTQIFESGLPDEQTYIIHRGATCAAMLNVFPYTTGHLLVIPYRQVDAIEDLTDQEHTELWWTVTDGVVAVKAAYHPGGVNVGLNLGRAAGGSINEHLHVHVVPRWAGDGNFMAAVANTRTLPEPLDESADKLRREWHTSHPQ